MPVVRIYYPSARLTTPALDSITSLFLAVQHLPEFSGRNNRQLLNALQLEELSSANIHAAIGSGLYS